MRQIVRDKIATSDGLKADCRADTNLRRCYDVREPVEVRISRDELVELSDPGPDRSIRLAQLRTGKAIPRLSRNHRSGEFLKELKFIEGRSTGIRNFMRTMKDNGSPPLT